MESFEGIEKICISEQDPQRIRSQVIDGSITLKKKLMRTSFGKNLDLLIRASFLAKLFLGQGRSQYEANRGTCLSHFFVVL